VSADGYHGDCYGCHGDLGVGHAVDIHHLMADHGYYVVGDGCHGDGCHGDAAGHLTVSVGICHHFWNYLCNKVEHAAAINFIFVENSF
jgi:hypothetical protein